jgi:hypothetical protein
MNIRPMPAAAALARLAACAPPRTEVSIVKTQGASGNTAPGGLRLEPGRAVLGDLRALERKEYPEVFQDAYRTEAGLLEAFNAGLRAKAALPPAGPGAVAVTLGRLKLDTTRRSGTTLPAPILPQGLTVVDVDGKVYWRASLDLQVTDASGACLWKGVLEAISGETHWKGKPEAGAMKEAVELLESRLADILKGITPFPDQAKAVLPDR